MKSISIFKFYRVSLLNKQYLPNSTFISNNGFHNFVKMDGKF